MVHRLTNAQTFKETQPTCNIPNIQNQLPINFPNTVQQLRQLNAIKWSVHFIFFFFSFLILLTELIFFYYKDDNMNSLLGFYGLPQTGSLQAKYQRFGAYVGLRLL